MRRAVDAAADRAAVDVLIDLRAVHQRAGEVDEVGDGVLARHIRVHLRRRARADRHDEQVVLARLPAQPVTPLRRHARDEEGGVVVGRQPAVLEEEGFARRRSGPTGRLPGGKKTGAAVEARTSCQSGICRLQSLRAGWL